MCSQHDDMAPRGKKWFKSWGRAAKKLVYYNEFCSYKGHSTQIYIRYTCDIKI